MNISQTETCPLCSNARIHIHDNRRYFDCLKCGEYSITRESYDDFINKFDHEHLAYARYILKHQHLSNECPDFSYDFFKELNNQKLIEFPSPSEQAENLIYYLGQFLKRPKEKLHFNHINEIMSITGSHSTEATSFIYSELRNVKRLIIEEKSDKK